MPYVIAFLATVIVPLIPSLVRGIVTYAAVSVGFSLIAYTGVSAAIDTFKDYIQANIDGLPSDAIAIIGMSGFPQAVNAVLTCIVFNFTLNGLMAATGYRPSWRRPSNPTDL